MSTLQTRLKAIGLDLPASFNKADESRLEDTKTVEELKCVHNDIKEEIFAVFRANLSINHSNF